MIGAIMQPYFFPYIGYYQLAYSVDKFIFLDDANFIKQGFINRNSIAINGKVQNFSIPVSKISSFRKINEHMYIDNFSKFLILIENAYGKYPYFQEIMPIIESVVLEKNLNVADKNSKSIIEIFNYLELNKNFLFASMIDEKKEKGQDRVIEICKKNNIRKYINSIGGKKIYSSDIFKLNNIELKFIKSINKPSQEDNEFIENLSIIDLLMRCDKPQILENFQRYDLIN